MRLPSLLTCLLFLACATGARGPQTPVTVDNHQTSAANVLLMDRATGMVLDRLYHLPTGETTRTVDFRRIKGRRLAVVVDLVGHASAYVLGKPGAVMTVVVDRPDQVLCIWVASLLRQSTMGLHTCR